MLLQRALISLLQQTYRNFEVLVCNDASDEKYRSEYEKVINRFQNSFIRLVYIYNESKMGACASRNRLIKESKGEYITGLDDDDFFFPRRLETFITFPNLHKYSCITTAVTGHENYKVHKINHDGIEIDFNQMKNGNKMGNQVFVERDKLIHCGMFDEEMPAWQDYDTWFRLIQRFGTAYKISQPSMYLDTEHSNIRISTSSKAYIGYKKFVAKHSSSLTGKNLKNLRYNDLLNRKQYIDLCQKELLCDIPLFFRVFKSYLVYRFPNLFSIYQKLMSSKLR
ncbi:Putative glycosyltransferase EpsE [Escherichia coli]|nr:glycosyl transferase [Escherichia coli]CAD5438519.1 hypothetical protein QREC_QR324_00075 [Escherichia coli]CAD5822556.1 putative glycosyl transferase [Escherichia coli]CAE7082572.1 Putative glycosyltransferase EpsE [Escherichia coli]CAH3687630.1 Putative glycosyltransferase EpsE [Escherichia coli]